MTRRTRDALIDVAAAIVIGLIVGGLAGAGF